MWFHQNPNLYFFAAFSFLQSHRYSFLAVIYVEPQVKYTGSDFRTPFSVGGPGGAYGGPGAPGGAYGGQSIWKPLLWHF